MSHIIKLLLLLIVYFCLITPRPAYAQNTNEAMEPAVNGHQAIDLLKGGTLDAWKIPSNNWYLEKGSIIGETGETELETPEWLYTRQRFSDFGFTCDLKLTGDNHRNTGILPCKHHSLSRILGQRH